MVRMRSTLAVAIGLVVNVVALAQTPAGVPEPPSYPLFGDFGAIPRPLPKQALLGLPAIDEELKLTAAQTTEFEAIQSRQFAKMQSLRREATDQQKFMEARDQVFKESEGAILKVLDQRQHERLRQIQLQVMGPFAFDPPPGMAKAVPNLVQQLKLTEDQVKQVQTLAQEGFKEIQKAAMVPIVLDPKAGAPSIETVRKLVESPEFKATKQKTRENARKAWDATMQRISEALTEPQRTAYREMLGAPFDLSKVRFGGQESRVDLNMVARALNLGGGGGDGGGGQRSDPDFSTKVAKPAYQKEHPRVLFDEAHQNFHTTTGRYKPFADLITSDGYTVTPQHEKFTKDVLAKGNIIVSANAVLTFTEPECETIRDWVRDGGSLLLITDHTPFGDAAAPLAKKFGVDMSLGYTSDPENSEGGATSLVFTRKNKLLGDHAITQGRETSEQISRIQTFTGQSLKGPEGSVAILKLGDKATDQTPGGKSVSAAGRAQGVALTFGKGRVVILGEAAELSAQLIGVERFGMNVPGIDNRQMALNIMHWLSGLLEPRSEPLKKAG